MNSTCSFTDHATVRMRQRGKSEEDVALIISYGTPTRDGYQLRGHDADARIHELKSEMHRIERLKGWFVITGDNERVITIYPARGHKPRRMRRHHEV